VPGQAGDAVMAFGFATSSADGGGLGRHAAGPDPIRSGPIGALQRRGGGAGAVLAVMATDGSLSWSTVEVWL
jgi:hypothetical protein